MYYIKPQHKKKQEITTQKTDGNAENTSKTKTKRTKTNQTGQQRRPSTNGKAPLISINIKKNTHSRKDIYQEHTTLKCPEQSTDF